MVYDTADTHCHSPWIIGGDGRPETLMGIDGDIDYVWYQGRYD